jgi:hypothetical protein
MNEAGKSAHISAETVPSAKHPAQALLDSVFDNAAGGVPPPPEPTPLTLVVTEPD